MGSHNDYSCVPGQVCTQRYKELAESGANGGSLQPWGRSLNSYSGLFPQGVFSTNDETLFRSLDQLQKAETKQEPLNNNHSDKSDNSAIDVVQNATFGLATNLTWDAYQRDLYKTINEGFTKQANELLKRGNVTRAELTEFVEMRNKLVLEARKPLSPFGKLYSEILKPSSNLPNAAQLLEKKGSIEAVLTSVGKTRVSVNKMAATFKIAGRGLIILNVTLSITQIAMAEPEDRTRVAVREGAGAVGSAVGGWAGAWVGCTTLASFASPSLIIPIWGEVTEAGACAVGGIVGMLAGGALVGSASSQAGETAYEIGKTYFKWTKE
jgi:hypothetical protein